MRFEMKNLHPKAIVSILVLSFSLRIQGNSSNYTFHLAFESVPVSWEESRRLCNMTGKDLVSIESVEEWQFLHKTIQTMQTSEYFIGLKNQSGEWRWVSNGKNKSSSIEYFNWVPGEPSGNGNCAKMFMSWKKHFLWYDDINCDQRKRGIGYICERANECNDEKESTTVLVTSSTKVNNKCLSTQVAATHLLPLTKLEAIHSTVSTKKLPETTATSQTTPAAHPGYPLDDCPAQKPSKTNPRLIVAVSSLLTVSILVNLIAFLAIFSRKLKNCRKKDARGGVAASSHLKEQERQSLSPENAARQLGLSADAGDSNNEHKNQQGSALPCNMEGGYAMLSPNTMMTEGGFYASPDTSQQGNSSREAYDESPTYANQMASSVYMNV